MKRTILFLAANPSGTSELALGRECAAIQHELQLARGRDDFEFHSRWAVGVDELMRCLNELTPTVLHFSGHGSRDWGRVSSALATPQRDVEASAEPGIILQENDGVHHVDHDALAKMIASVPPVPRLVVLNACHSASVAASLRRVVDCVVGVNDAIDDATARSFAVGFYRALGNRCPVGIAVEQAAATLFGKKLPGELVTCHARDGIDAHQLYVTASGIPTPTRFPIGSEAPPMAPGQYDLFVAHPTANKATARALYDQLQQLGVRVFLASRSLSADERSPAAVASAQRNSRATVLLISPHADAAWYLGDELVTAIEAHRAAPEKHRLVPVLLEDGLVLPSALRHVEPIVAQSVGDLSGVAARLRDLVSALPQDAAPLGPRVDRRGGSDYLGLYDRLGRLNDATLEQIVALSGIERGSLAPRTAAVAERALDIAQLAALDPALCHRISVELDRRARWTRR